MTELNWLCAEELRHGYANKQFTPIDVTVSCLDRIRSLNSQFCAFAHIDEEGALGAARASAERWQKGEPIGLGDGIPTTIKDLVLTKGWPCRRGSKTTKADPTTWDAPAVANLRGAGAILLGSTTTPEFGWKAVTDNPRGHIARNPYLQEMTTGGSSGGAAAAAALGMGVWHVGTDGGGSIRIPAGFCGLFGIKPTFGRVPARPISPFGTVSHLGPMTRNVADGAAMLDIMSQSEPRDWHNLPTLPNVSNETMGNSRQLKIAYSEDLGHLDVDDDIRRIFRQAIDRIQELGCHVIRKDPPIAPCKQLFDVHWYSGAANLLETIEPGQHDCIDPGLREIAKSGAQLSGATLRLAAMQRGALGEAMQNFLIEHDILLTPTTSLAAFEAGQETPPGRDMKRWIEWAGFSYPFNLTQQPAATIRCGTTSSGLPIGLQLVSAKYTEGLLFDVATLLEANGFGFERPSL